MEITQLLIVSLSIYSSSWFGQTNCCHTYVVPFDYFVPNIMNVPKKTMSLICIKIMLGFIQNISKFEKHCIQNWLNDFISMNKHVA